MHIHKIGEGENKSTSQECTKDWSAFKLTCIQSAFGFHLCECTKGALNASQFECTKDSSAFKVVCIQSAFGAVKSPLVCIFHTKGVSRMHQRRFEWNSLWMHFSLWCIQSVLHSQRLWCPPSKNSSKVLWMQVNLNALQSLVHSWKVPLFCPPSVFVYVHICVYVCVYVLTCICVCVCVCMYVCMYVCNTYTCFLICWLLCFCV